MKSIQKSKHQGEFQVVVPQRKLVVVKVLIILLVKSSK